MARIDVLLRGVRDQSASDLHLTAGAPPVLRVHGEICPIEFQELTPEQCRRLLYEIMTDEQVAQFEKTGDIDFSYEIAGELRVRANVYEQHLGIAACFRLLPTQILSVDQLELPRDVLRFTEIQKGLVVVTGPPGSGKSSTLAALIDHINTNQRKHIITIEDPIEFVHKNKKSLVNQREVGRHTSSFADALRAALREDPDIILVGEMRDRETIQLALTAAEVGQVVFGTLHTSSAAQTVNRIIDVFPADEQEQVRTVLADSLRGVVAQRLLRRSDRDGRIAAVELLFVTPAVAALVRDKKTMQILSAMQVGKKEGMMLFEDAVLQLLRDGKITQETAGVRGRDASSAKAAVE
ncbi:MAG: type IV pilus twitching motility protein PilT [bacterium]